MLIEKAHTNTSYDLKANHCLFSVWLRPFKVRVRKIKKTPKLKSHVIILQELVLS